MTIISFILNLFNRYPALLILNLFLMLILAGVQAFSLITLAPIVDILTKPDLVGVSPLTNRIIEILSSLNLPASLLSVLLLFVFLNIIQSIIGILVEYFVLKAKFSIVGDLLLGTFEDFFNARWYFFSSGEQGKFINTFIRETQYSGDAFRAMGRFFSGICQIIMLFIIPFYISWQTTLIAIAIAAVISLPIMLLGKISVRLGKINTDTANEMSSVIQSSLTAAKVILGYGNQKHAKYSLLDAFNNNKKANIKAQTMRAGIPKVYMPFGLLIVISALYTARSLGVHLSEIAVILYSLLRVVPMIGTTAATKHQIENLFPSYNQILELKKRAHKFKQPSGIRKFEQLNEAIIIDNLSFSYPDDKPVLININSRINKGNMVAFVGASGSGKSTFADMVMGFNKPLNGSITIDGVNLFDFDIVSYRKKIGYVPQESILFNTTILDNLLWANKDASLIEVEEASKMANADEFINKLPNKYDTIVGDRGVRLSGGQVQRIALARAIIRNPDIFILDEATSALDTHSEKLIQNSIENISKEKTILIIAHRLTTVKNADNIYILNKGKIVEEGSFDDLNNKDGYFNKMVKAQSFF